MNPPTPENAFRWHGSPKAMRGFTLVEMLVVIAIMSILLTAAGPVLDRLTSSYSPATVASTVAAQLERSRSHAVANNTFVWVRLGAVREEPNDFFIGIYESIDGTATATAANVRGTWSAPRFADLKLSNSLIATFERPPVPTADRPDTACWVRFNPAGEASILPGAPTETRIKPVPPSGAGTAARWTEIGLQPTRRGKVVGKLNEDVAAVHLSGLTGQALAITR